MNLVVGDVWLAHHREMSGLYWTFEIVAEVQGKNGSLWIAVKQKVPEHAICFDENGKDQNDEFYLVERSRAKKRIRVKSWLEIDEES